MSDSKKGEERDASGRVPTDDVFNACHFDGALCPDDELEALLAQNGALRRAISDRDAQLRDMARRAQAEHKRLRAQVKELQRAGEGEGNRQGRRDAAASTLLKLSRRVQEAEAELRAQERRTQAALAEAEALEAELDRLSPPMGPRDCGGGEGDGDASQPISEQDLEEPEDSERVVDGEVDVEGEGEGEGEGEVDGDGSLETSSGAWPETVEQVSEQLERTTQRLVEIRSHNTQLRHELMLAKKVLAAEVGDPAAVAAALGAGGGWRGRNEQIEALALKATELQERVQQVRGECSQRRQQLKESSSTEDDYLRPVTRVAVTPREQSSSGLPTDSMCSLATTVAGDGGSGVMAAAAERRAAAEADAAAARAAAEAADAQVAQRRAKNAQLEMESQALRERQAQLVAKADHDRQLARAVTEQVKAAEAQLRIRERKVQQTNESSAQELRQLEQELVRLKSVVAHLKNVLAEKERVLQAVMGYVTENEEKDQTHPQNNARNASPATRAREDRARTARLRAALNTRSSERARLQHLVDRLARNLDARETHLDATREALRSLRQSTAGLETDIARLEMQRGGGGSSARDRHAAPDDFRSRLDMMEAENASLRARLERALAERDETKRTCAALLDPRLNPVPPSAKAASPRSQRSDHALSSSSRSGARSPISGCKSGRRSKRTSASVGRSARAGPQ